MPDTGHVDLNTLLEDAGLVALVATQGLRPVEGAGRPFFPPTYLGSDDKPTYCISARPGGGNLCVVDSVQSQANRIEEALMQPLLRDLTRRVEVTASLPNGATRTLDMLQLGHRLADAAVAFSDLAERADAAMRSYLRNGPDEIARLSPTSLLMGLWQSRGEGEQLKIPRAFGATITAQDVTPLRRMATFTGSFWSKELGLEGTRSTEGLDPVPAGESLGGVIAAGPVERHATLNLVALRHNVFVQPGRPVGAAARYVFGLGLVAMTLEPECFLRQGCLLVAYAEPRLRAIDRRGREQAVTLSFEQALAYAREAARAFGVPELPAVSAGFSTARLEKPRAAKEKSGRGR